MITYIFTYLRLPYYIFLQSTFDNVLVLQLIQTHTKQAFTHTRLRS